MTMEEHIQKLESMKHYVEGMNKNHHIEILKILQTDPSIKLNENKSGIYINLSCLNPAIFTQIEEYLNYIRDQEQSLSSLETQKRDYINTFFREKDNKDICTSNITTDLATATTTPE
jgi:hypothetical protein